MDDETRDERDARTLRRITATLGIPIKELSLPRSAAGSSPSLAEVEDLLRVFRLLRDPRARARVMAAAEVELSGMTRS